MNHVGIHPIEKYGRPLETAVYSRYFPAIKNEKMDGNEVKLVGEWPPKRAERRIEWPLDLNLKPWNDRGELRRGAAGWRWRRWRLLTWWRTPPVAMTTSPLAPVDNPSVTSPPTSCYDNAATLHRCHDDPYSLPPPTPPPAVLYQYNRQSYTYLLVPLFHQRDGRVVKEVVKEAVGR